MPVACPAGAAIIGRRRKAAPAVIAAAMVSVQVHTMLSGSAAPHFLIVIVATTAVYIFLVLAIMFFGKREIGQLSITDLVFILLISNALQNAMVNGDWNSLWVGIVAALTLFVLNFMLKKLVYKSPKLNKLIEGSPFYLYITAR